MIGLCMIGETHTGLFLVVRDGFARKYGGPRGLKAKPPERRLIGMQALLEQPLLLGEDRRDSAEDGRLPDLPSCSWSGLCSRLTFAWVAPLLALGSRTEQLHQADLPEVAADVLPAACGDKLWAAWRCEAANAAHVGRLPSLLWAVVSAFGGPFFRLGLLKLLNDALNFAGPVFLNGLLRFLGSSKRAAAESDTASGEWAGHAWVPWLLQQRRWQTSPNLLGWQLDVHSAAFGAWCAGLLAASLLLKAFLNSHYNYRQGIVANRIRAGITCMVFRQTLALSAANLAAVGTGKVQTLMSVDADRLVGLCMGFHELWSLPVQIGVALWLLYTQVQFAFLAGLAIVLLIIPLNRLLANAIQRASVKLMAAKDRRLQVMSELIRGMRQIKAATWEGAFAARVGAARTEELQALAVRKYLDALCVYLWAATSLLFTLVTFGLYALLGRTLTAEAVFTSLALFNVLLAPINAFPWVLNGLVEAVVSVRRLGEYLLQQSVAEVGGTNGLEAAAAQSVGGSTGLCLPEGPTEQEALLAATSSVGSSVGCVGRSSLDELTNERIAVRICQGSFSWTEASSCPVLSGIDLSIVAGTFVAVTGGVGAGKSTLLCAVLGELQRLRGSVALHGCTAYVAQDSWAMHGSIRDNILLGAPLQAQRYQQVLHACALLPDLAAMPGGDAAEVGDRGAKLSGGQRARLALARALYREDCNIYLLDDVLAAVDAPVAAWLVDHALRGPLLQGKTVLAVTHSPSLLAAVDVMITVESGRIASVVEQRAARDSGSGGLCMQQAIGCQSEAVRSVASPQENGGTAEAAADLEHPPRFQQQLEEERETGHVRWGVYSRYMRLQGAWVALTLVSMALMQATRNGSDLWLSFWVSHPRHPVHTPESSSTSTGAAPSPLPAALLHRNGALQLLGPDLLANQPPLDPDVKFYLTGLLILAAVNSLFTLARAFAFAQGGLVAARRLHRRLLLTVLALPASFFDSTPTGRILNRFSSDTATADDSLPFIANIFLAQAFGLAGVAVVLSFTQPYLIVALLPLTLMYRHLQTYYRATSRELRRLEAVAKSPVYSAFSSALDGGPTIRAFRAEQHFMHSAEDTVAAQQRASLASLAASCWLGLRLQAMAAGIAAAVAGLAVAQRSAEFPGASHSTAAAGLVGLSLAYVLPITGLLNGLLMTGAETEQEMVSVERIVQYLELQPQEEILPPPSTSPSPSSLSGRENGPSLDSTSISPLNTAGLRAGGAIDHCRHFAPQRAATLRPPRAHLAGGVPEDWPQAGSVMFSDVWLRYIPQGPFVLRRLDLDVPAGTKLGLCGRTGAGKSSLVAALLRLNELSAGAVRMDGVDIRSVPLRRLRRAVGYVPQAPFIFSGSLRDNLDPLRRSADGALVAALQQVTLWGPMLALCGVGPNPAPRGKERDIPNGVSRPGLLEDGGMKHSVLSMQVGQGGVSLSQGQQQLLSLARVLLGHPKIVCLDECTASVDPGTAAVMRRVVRNCLGGATVIEVAHHLASIAACDVVAVMEGGRVVEAGRAEELVGRESSVFGFMMRQQQTSRAAGQRISGGVPTPDSQ